MIRPVTTAGQPPQSPGLPTILSRHTIVYRLPGIIFGNFSVIAIYWMAA
ncbi:hypothetical protein [Haloferula sp.]